MTLNRSSPDAIPTPIKTKLKPTRYSKTTNLNARQFGLPSTGTLTGAGTGTGTGNDTGLSTGTGLPIQPKNEEGDGAKSKEDGANSKVDGPNAGNGAKGPKKVKKPGANEKSEGAKSDGSKPKIEDEA